MRLLEEGQQIIGVASRDSVEQMQMFVDRHDLQDVINIADVDGLVWERFGVFGQPTWAFVDGETGEFTVRFGGLGEAGVLQAFEQRGFA